MLRATWFGWVLSFSLCWMCWLQESLCSLKELSCNSGPPVSAPDVVPGVGHHNWTWNCIVLKAGLLFSKPLHLGSWEGCSHILWADLMCSSMGLIPSITGQNWWEPFFFLWENFPGPPMLAEKNNCWEWHHSLPAAGSFLSHEHCVYGLIALSHGLWATV